MISREMKLNHLYPSRSILLSTVDSTNLFCRRHASDESFFVWSRRQNQGKGQFGRIWNDFGTGNLFLSVSYNQADSLVERVSADTRQNSSSMLAQLTFLVGLALHQALQPLVHVDLSIKWPNDIFYQLEKKRFKISGILCESVISGHELQQLVIGIGINLRAPASTTANAGADSLYDPGFVDQISKRKFSKGLILRRVLMYLQQLLSDYYRMPLMHRESLVVEYAPLVLTENGKRMPVQDLLHLFFQVNL